MVPFRGKALTGVLNIGGGKMALDVAQCEPSVLTDSSERRSRRNEISRWWSKVVRRTDYRISLLAVLLASGDLVGAAVALALSPLADRTALVVLTCCLTCRAAGRLYRPRLRLSFFDDLPRAVVALGAGLALATTVVVSVGYAELPLRDLLVTALTLFAVAELCRAVTLQVARTARRALSRGDRTLVVGPDEDARRLVDTMIEHPEFGLRPVGVASGRDACDRYGAASLPVPTYASALIDVAEIAERVDAFVVVLIPPVDDAEVVETATAVRALGRTVLVLPQLAELYRDGADVERLRSYPLLRVGADPTRRPTWIIKRATDVAVAAVALAVLLPLLTVIALAVLLESGRPVIFAQERIGRAGRPFTIRKFRSLGPVDEEEAATRWTVAADRRIGPVGRFLRRSSLDELPQLWNILCGDMSFVGPRPERPVFVERFSADHSRYAARHRVPAGLTGLAQINGLRGDTCIADRARYDNYYIASWSLWLDLRIMLMTMCTVVRRGQH